MFSGFVCSFCFALLHMCCQINVPKMNCKNLSFHAAYENNSNLELPTSHELRLASDNL